MTERWSAQRAWEWYDSFPWLRGCNFLPSNAVNSLDIWQSLRAQEILACMDEELALLHDTGMNAVRMSCSFTVWEEEHDHYFRMMDAMLALCEKHGVWMMPIFGNDCLVPKELYRKKHVGPQEVALGYHGGTRTSPHQAHDAMGYSPMDDPAEAQRYVQWVRETVSRYRDDKRIFAWDIFNEPGNSGRTDVTLPHVKLLFEAAREVDPLQPLTAGVWHDFEKIGTPQESAVDRYLLENSDLISYHCYGDILAQVEALARLKTFGRPIMNTEWLCRCLGCNIKELFPLFCLERVACLQWGFVAGRSQTFEPHTAAWELYAAGKVPQFDFRLWFHDLYRPSHHPYDPHEIDVIRQMCALADMLPQKAHQEEP